jgi:hypothetical protein
MANQALINAAQKLYSAKAQQTDVTPIIQGAADITGSIMNAIAERQKQQKEDTKKTFEPFKVSLLKNDKLRAEFTTKLEDLQEEYYKNQKRSENPLVREDGDNGRKAARDRNTQIEALLSTYNNQLNKVDLNRSLDVGYSKFNKVGDQFDYTMYKDKKLVDFVKITDEGLTFTDHTGKPQPLDKGVTLVPRNEQGITKLVNVNSFAQQEGGKGTGYEGSAVEYEVLNVLNTEMDTKSNWKSILFDDIGPFNWVDTNLQNGSFPGSTEFFEKHKDKSLAEQKEELKDLINNPEKADAFIEDFKNDYIATVKQVNADALSKYEAGKNEIKNRYTKGKNYQLSTTAQYVEKDYVENVYDQMKGGYVLINNQPYFKDPKDGLFYASDSYDKLIKSKPSESNKNSGLADETIARLKGVEAYANEFSYDFGPDNDLKKYQFKDDDNDGVPNFLDKTSDKESLIRIADVPAKQDNI